MNDIDINDGNRIDGRGVDELRPITIKAGVLNQADGSSYLEWGKNKIYAAVYGPRQIHPRYLQDPTGAVVQAYYNMISFSVTDRKRPGPNRRSTEISKVTSEALAKAVFLDQFPRTTIDVYIEVVQADAGTRCAGITAASVALADAGIPMKDLVCACASGKVSEKMVLDLGKEEDNLGNADVPMALIPSTEEIVLLQMDGQLTPDEFSKAMEMNKKAIKEKIYPIQVAALKDKYSTEEEDYSEDEGDDDDGAYKQGGRSNV